MLRAFQRVNRAFEEKSGHISLRYRWPPMKGLGPVRFHEDQNTVFRRSVFTFFNGIGYAPHHGWDVKEIACRKLYDFQGSTNSKCGRSISV